MVIPNKLLGIMMGLIGALGGAVVGVLCRQPEINRLKKQVIKLQGEIVQLQALRKSQNEKIEELLVQLKTLKLFQFSSKLRVKEKIRGELIFQYGMQEYLEMLIDTVKEKKTLSEEEVLFFNIFEKIVNGEHIQEEEKKAVKEYIMYKYSRQIGNLKQCDVTEKLEELESLDKKKIKIRFA